MKWLPRHGEPINAVERLVQSLVRALAHLPVYTATVVTLTLVLVWMTR